MNMIAPRGVEGERGVLDHRTTPGARGSFDAAQASRSVAPTGSTSLLADLKARCSRVGIVIRILAATLAAIAIAVMAVQTWTLLIVNQTEMQAAQRSLETNMAVLKQELGRVGTEWALGDGILSLGGATINDREDLVDVVRRIAGGTATIFAGDLRVATNISMPDGTRAVGTVLAAGPARDAVIGRGETYRGVNQILGVPHLTIYEPLRDRAGHFVGILFVGVPLSAAHAVMVTLAVRSTVAASVVLLAACVLGWLALRFTLQPLRTMAAAVRTIAGGELDRPTLFTDRADQLGEIGRAIETLRQKALLTRTLQDDLRANEELLRLGMEIGGIGAFRHDIRTNLVTIGAELRAIFGLPAGDTPIQVEDWIAAVLPEDRERLLAQLYGDEAGPQTGKAVEFGIRHFSNGGVRQLEARSRRYLDDNGRVISVLGVIIDVTERRQAHAQIAHMAQHDALTGLPNRVLFRQRLEEAVARSHRGDVTAVLFLDLDRFKAVNDSLGHPVGDALLRAVTKRLTSDLRESDTVARLGGDEFAIIQVGIDQPNGAIALARRLIEALGRPYDIDGHTVSIGASIGIAMTPDDGTDPDTLLMHADLALYRAKGDGRGTWRFFEQDMDALMRARRALELDLRGALDSGQFELFYQPVVSLRTRNVSGFEALIRWRHPKRGLVPPDAFIPLAEEIGLIVPIGAWVLRRACADAAQWAPELKVSVNLSPIQFTGEGPVSAVTAALAASGLDPARLELELTERVLLDDTVETMRTMNSLKALGVTLALDDFGTGYSSLSYLRKFPFDRVKIDKSFISDLACTEGAAIVEAVTGLCETLGMVTTVEGVETEKQLQWLRAGSCTNVQGFLFSRPCPADEVPALSGLLRVAAQPADDHRTLALL